MKESVSRILSAVEEVILVSLDAKLELEMKESVSGISSAVEEVILMWSVENLE